MLGVWGYGGMGVWGYGGMGVWGNRSGKVLIKTSTIETAKVMGGNLG